MYVVYVVYVVSVLYVLYVLYVMYVCMYVCMYDYECMHVYVDVRICICCTSTMRV